MQHNENNDISFENQKILDIHMEKEVQKSFIEYAMSVIVSRALPDVRDGMKPGTPPYFIRHVGRPFDFQQPVL